MFTALYFTIALAMTIACVSALDVKDWKQFTLALVLGLIWPFTIITKLFTILMSK